jgi:integrase
MRVSVFTYHNAACIKKHNHPRSYKRCKCPKWHYSSSWRPKQRSAKTRSWDEAESRARKLEAGDTVPDLNVRTVEDAVKAYLSDVASRNLSENYQAKLKRELGELGTWAKVKPVPGMRHWTLQLLEEFRSTWTEGPVTRRKRQERMRSFFLYCDRHGWIEKNPAKSLSHIKVDEKPTDYFTKDEMAKIFAAIGKYETTPETRAKLTGVVMLMRWSGLRLGDAVRLDRARVNNGELLLYTAKTGTPVFCPLPPKVVATLEGITNSNPRYFFWTGLSTENNAGDPFWRHLEKALKLAKLGKRAHPHMFRDTFAVEMLLAGVPLDQVSMLLGHTSVKITEKHYSPWVKARQEQLKQSVVKAWE